MINEDHLFPQNRIFVHKIIRHFINDTNYYFFSEALSQDLFHKGKDTLTIGKKYGYYLEEPQMAENIRFLLHNNKDVYCYESRNEKLQTKDYYNLNLESKVSNLFYNTFLEQTKKEGFYLPSMNIRDMNQFINFYKKYQIIKKKNPNAKFIILCGFGHIKENKRIPLRKITWFNFAYLLKNHLKIDPTTIEITELTDKCVYYKNSHKRSKYYDVIKNYMDDASFYYIHYDSLRKHNAVRAIHGSATTDYYIYSPVVGYDKNRENWLKYDGKKEVFVEKKYFIKSKKKTPVIKAYYKNEDYKQSTPADILYINKKVDNYLLLYKGKYDIYSDDKYMYSITFK